MNENSIVSAGSPVKDFVNNFFSQLKEGLNEQGLILCSHFSEVHLDT